MLASLRPSARLPLAAVITAAILAALFAAILAAIIPAAHAADEEFLPPEQVFRYTVSSDGATVQVAWHVAKGYYLYQGRMGLGSAMPGITVGTPTYPAGEIHEDEYFGRQTIHRGDFVVRAPLARTPGAAGPLSLELKLQGCADAGLCYPPQKWQATVNLPAAGAVPSNSTSGITGGTAVGSAGGGKASATAGSANGTPSDALSALLARSRAGAAIGGPSSPTPAATAATASPVPAANPVGAAAGADEFLPPEQAFQLEAVAAGADRVRLRWEIADGYYLYRERLKVKTSSPSARLGQLSLPAGQRKTDEYFGEQEVYHDELVATIDVSRAASPAGSRAGGAALDLPLEVTYQGCAEAGLCYPPITQKLVVQLSAGGMAGGNGGAAGGGGPAGGSVAGGSAGGAGSAGPDGGSASAGGGFVSEQDRLAALIRDGNLLLVLGTFFGLGLLLAFTPCCLPMVPILSGIIAGHGPGVTTGRAFALSLAYVLGMAFTYTVAGAAFAAAGQQVQAIFQQTWIVVLFAGLFIVLALSMFGLFTVQVPASIQTRLAALSNRQTAGTFGGVAVMGALSALIVTTCVAPPLVATLAVIGQSGDVARGAAALFAMSLGMGAPLLIVGASAGKLLPKAGPWMDTVKKLFGVMMLAVAAWMLARVVPGRVGLVLWAVPALATGWLLLTGMKSRTTVHWGLRLAGAAAGLYGVVLLAGAALGGSDPLAPLPRADARADELPFRTIKSVGDLDREITAASAVGRPVMLDFYADWCTSCLEMERFTFSDAAVRETLGRAVLLRADVTRNDDADQALLKRFGIFGPPTIAFYGADGTERRNYRVVGYMKAPEFARLAHEALSGPRL